MTFAKLCEYGVKNNTPSNVKYNFIELLSKEVIPFFNANKIKIKRIFDDFPLTTAITFNSPYSHYIHMNKFAIRNNIEYLRANIREFEKVDATVNHFLARILNIEKAILSDSLEEHKKGLKRGIELFVEYNNTKLSHKDNVCLGRTPIQTLSPWMDH
jgi:hypothetical protein